MKNSKWVEEGGLSKYNRLKKLQIKILKSTYVQQKDIDYRNVLCFYWELTGLFLLIVLNLERDNSTWVFLSTCAEL